MNAAKVKKCSEQLKRLLAEQHNALDAGVRKQLEEVVEALEVAASERDWGTAAAVLISISSFLRVVTNIADLITRVGND